MPAAPPADLGGGSGSGSLSASGSATLLTMYRNPSRLHLVVVAGGSFRIDESFTSDDGTTWWKFKSTSSGVVANPTDANNDNFVEIADVILLNGHRYTIVDLSVATNPYQYSFGSAYVDKGL